MEDKEYLENYEQNLVRNIITLCSGCNRLSGKLLPSEDLDNLWEAIAQPYIGDAVKEIAKYPTVALGWMMYVGIAAAHFWDEDWNLYGKLPNLYEYIRDKRGFDCLDEYVRETVLGLSQKKKDGDTMSEYDQMEELVRECSTLALNQIRHEQVEPQSPMAFHIFVRSIHALYLIGISVELKRLGYNYSEA